jgi:hypothetical protein
MPLPADLDAADDPAAIAAALGQLQLDELAFGGTRGGSA